MAYFGYEKANYIDRYDVAAAVWWEQHAPAGSVLGLVAPDFPSRLTQNYNIRIFGSAPSLTDQPHVLYRPIEPADAAKIALMLAKTGARDRYIAITPSEERFIRLYRLFPNGSLERLEQVLDASRRFVLVYRNGPARIYKEVK
jgi:hypothetical protein